MLSDATQPEAPIQVCPLCHGETHAVVPAGERPLRHCPRCDLISVPGKWHLSRDDQRARYLQHQNTADHAGYVERFDRLIEIVHRHAPSAHRVLDYGCGPTPVFVDLLRRAGYEAAGYDPIFAPDEDLTRPFDVIVSVETFEHFAEPARELQRVTSLLKPGGVLAIMTMFHSGPGAMKDWWYARDRTHTAFYSPATILHIQSVFGFDAIPVDASNVAVLRKRG